jgi:hypothetical protein
VIKGIHGLLYSADAAASRAFFRDQLKLPSTDVGDRWLIFDFAEGDLGVHPIEHGGNAGDHDVSFYCDDIHGTVAELKGRGVEFTDEVQDHGYGFVTHLNVPGGLKVQLYEPKYVKAARSVGAPRKKNGSARVAKKKSVAKAKKKR